jgi:probable rRNA maturation factor
MRVHIEDEVNVIFDFDLEEVARQVIQTTLDIERCPFEVAVNLLITNDKSIQAINLEYRNIDKPTDVLSFPVVTRERLLELFSWQNPPKEPKGNRPFEASFDPDSGELILGDIVLSVDTLARQAKEYGHSNKREFAFLIAHSMLHLLGYDHLEDEGQLLIEEKQDKILDSIQIYR